MKLKYFLDHPQIKRRKSLGNGNVPNDWGTGETPSVRAESQSRKANKRFSKLNSPMDHKGVQHSKKANEAVDVGNTQNRERSNSYTKPKKSYDSNTRLGESKTKDKIQ